MGNSFIILHLELNAIKHFLDYIIQGSGEEIGEISQKNENGYFNEFDDYENAISYPLLRQEIAVRAVFYEITSLVEHELQNSAQKAWQLSKKHKGPKSLLELCNLPNRDIRPLKMVSDLKFSDILKLIEEYYQIKAARLPGYTSVLKIREIVNAFKHRKGFKDFRKINPSKINLELYRPEVEEAYDAVKQTEIFIKALWAVTEHKTKS